MYAREGNAVLAGQARDAAFKVSTTPQQRQDVGEFLYDHGWNDLAEREYDDLLRMDTDIAAPGRAEADANAHFRLAGIALIRGDDLAVARNKEQAMKLLGNDADLAMTDNQGRQWPISNSELWADIHWHYLRAALARHDDSEAQQQVGQLLALKPTDPDIALDAVPFLTRLGRTADAQAIFDSAFTAMKARLNADPKNPELLNAIAWLCAQCDRKLPEARAWARQAGDLMPNDAAIIDTLADVNFQLGNAKEAARLETKALQLDPGDDFMTAQLHRFRAAAATRPSAAPN
jgi:tetratricopeptide (TPR) repeat protein